MITSSNQLLSQLLLPLQGVVDFFSTPVPAAASLPRTSVAAKPHLAKAPALAQKPHAAVRATAQPAGIHLVGQGLMGQMGHMTLQSQMTQPMQPMQPGPSMHGKSAAQILRSRRAQDGRIVISGRMRDVCAELDRLCDETA
jgi:hypothetical protein